MDTRESWDRTAKADGERKQLRDEIQRLKDEIVRVHWLPCQKCIIVTEELRKAETERDAAIEVLAERLPPMEGIHQSKFEYAKKLAAARLHQKAGE